MQVAIPPTYAIAHVIQIIESQSIKSLKTKFSFLREVCFGREGLWPRGFFASCIGLDEKQILA